MSLGTAFWIIFLIWLLFDAGFRSGTPALAGYWWGPWIILVLLIGLLGWHDFGFIIHQ